MYHWAPATAEDASLILHIHVLISSVYIGLHHNHLFENTELIKNNILVSQALTLVHEQEVGIVYFEIEAWLCVCFTWD